MMKKMMMCTCGTSVRDIALLVLRVATGLVFVLHGYQKLQMGLPVVAGFLAQIGFPFAGAFAILLIASEIIGGSLLILGACTHWAAKLVAFVALVAFLTVHITHGYFLAAGGYEYIILIFAAAFALVSFGAGKYSLDALFMKKMSGGAHHGGMCGCGDCDECHVGHVHGEHGHQH